jgi:K+-sensing histidine kinase KdpD
MALKMNKEIGNKNIIQVNLANVGYVYCHMRQYDEALHYQFMAMAASKELHNDNSLAVDLGNIGETYLAMAAMGDNSNNAFAIKYLSDAVQLCRKLNYAGPLAEYSKCLSEAYEHAGQHKNALEAYKQYTATKDSVFSLERTMQMARLETQREIALKNKDLQIKDKQIKIHQLELSKKRSESILYVIGIILLVVLVGFAMKAVVSYRKSNKQLVDERQSHLTMIEEQILHIKERNEVLEEMAHMQAHDIRGPVATILGLAQTLDEENPADPSNKIVIDGIKKMAERLDRVIKEIMKRKNKLT